MQNLILQDLLYRPKKQTLRLANSSIDITYKPIIMGILNRTTDSFFDNGQYFDFDKFLAKAESLVHDGADILDIGGVKAGVGEPITLNQELDRVIPAIEALNARFDTPLSVDTWDATVLEESAKAGAVIGNDISGFMDRRYLMIAAKYDLAVVATHIRLKPRVYDPNPHYDDLIKEVTNFLQYRIQLAIDAGINKNSIMADMGPDLGKSTVQSLQLLKMSRYFRETLDVPMFLAVSNKDFVGDILGLKVTERTDVSNAAIAIGYLSGHRIFRVHEVSSAAHMTASLSYVLKSKFEMDVTKYD